MEKKIKKVKPKEKKLRLFSQCDKYGLPLWQCPHFIFTIMGIIIMLVSILTFQLGSMYVGDSLIVAFVVLLSTAVLFILSFIVTHSFEKLAEAARMKMEFLTIMSHQIRAPFSNLRWSIELLLSERTGNLDKKQIEYLDILKENSSRLEELIDKIITVSKIEQGKFPIKKKEFSMKDLVDKVALGFKAYSEASNVELKFDCQENLPKVFADFEQIREVVENFVDNAIKYTKDRGDVKINISSKGKELYFEIKDSGVGIPKDDQKFIFQKFFRSENVKRRQTQGSGLGLFIVKSIIESHGGKIGFYSEEGKGTTFWFTLPFVSSKK